MKTRFFLTVAVVSLISSMAFAQGTMTAGGISFDVTMDGWVIATEEDGAMAMHEDGCLMMLGAVAMDEVEATLTDLDAALDFITVSTIDGGADEEGNILFTGTGLIAETGENVEFMLVGGPDESGMYGLLFAGHTTDAACAPDMVAFIESLE
jgi:hypothetical protein